ncbi:hypothetical protein Tco_0063846, partial [Tanacetum coccineum]
ASSSTSDIHLPVQHQEIAEEPIHEDTPIIHDVLHPSHNLVTGDPEKDFRNLHPNDFEDLFLLNIQEKLNHLPKTDKTSLHTAINLERPNWDAADYYPKPRAVVYRDRNDQRKLMRLKELHKFSNGMLTRVMEKLDHMVKDFHLFEYNKGMETRKWSEDDKRRSKDFITAIEKRLQIRRIYRSLESFVGGRIRDIDYRLINRTT